MPRFSTRTNRSCARVVFSLSWTLHISQWRWNHVYVSLVRKISTSKHSCQIYSLPYEFPLSGTKKTAFAQAISNFLLAYPVVIYIVGTSQFLTRQNSVHNNSQGLCVSHSSRKNRNTRVSRSKQAMFQERRIQPITARAGWITISYKQALIGGKQ